MGSSPFIVSQKLWLWKRAADEFFGRLPGVVKEREERRWDREHSVERPEAAWVRLPREALRRAELDGTRLDRVVFVVDSGMGKTKNLERLQYELCRDDGSQSPSSLLPIFLEADDLPSASASDEELLRKLWRAVCSKDHGYPALEERQAHLQDNEPAALEWLRQLRRSGRLVLLIDALDQATDSKLKSLCEWLGKAGAFVPKSSTAVSSEWQRCRFVVTGRPFVIQDERFRELFADDSRGWRFVELDPFRVAEQQAFLGRFPDGTERWDKVPPEARSLLGTPRVCQYLNDLPDEKWPSLRTASDVYFQALWFMVEKGLKAEPAREFGSGSSDPDQQIKEALQFLGAMAFEMIARPGESSETLRHRVPRDEHHSDEYEDYRKKVRTRLQESFEWKGKKEFAKDWDALKGMNSAVEFWFLEETKQQVVQFRDATIKEFVAAHWVAKYGTENDARKIKHWIYLPDRPKGGANTNPQFAWFWRYLCEMPRGGRSPKSWLSAIAPLFSPNANGVGGSGSAPSSDSAHADGVAVKRAAGRPCEMMYRAWRTLTEYRDGGAEQAQAQAIVNDFLAEFPAILTSAPVEIAKIAAELVPEPQLKKLVTDPQRLKLILPPAEAPAYVRCPPEGLDGHRFMRGTDLDTRDRAGNEFHRWTREDPRHEVRLTPFWLKATHVTRAEFALFDPTHEQAFEDDLKRYAPETDCPVLDVSWYQGWCLAVWTGCALPTEAQFEFGVRAGCDAKVDLFPHGDTASSFQINCDGTWPFAGSEVGPYLRHAVSVRFQGQASGAATAPRLFGDATSSINDTTGGLTPPRSPGSGYAPNAWGVWHPVGQAWVWCADWFGADEYQRCHDEGVVDDPIGPDSGTSRVLRGGAWYDDPSDCRSAFRLWSSPVSRVNYSGLRLVCVVCVRTP